MAQPAVDPYEHLPYKNIDVRGRSHTAWLSSHNMDWMRVRNVTRACGRFFRNVPMTSATPGYRRINLIHVGMPTVSLIIDEKDSYLIAFRRGDGNGMHFTDKTLPEVPGPRGELQQVAGTPIQLSSSYISLIQAKERPYFSVGKFSLQNAYHILLNYDATVALGTPVMTKQRKALTQLIVMFCEASRFGPLCDSILQTMGTDRTDILDDEMWTWINNWSSLSAFAGHCKEMEIDGIELDPVKVAAVAECNVQNGDDVARVLRLIMTRRRLQ